MKFERTILSVDVYGKEFKLTKLTTKQAGDFGEKTKGLSESEMLDPACDLLAACGLPKDVSMSMEMEHLVQLMEALFPKGKK